MLIKNLYGELRNIHRKIRKQLKSALKPEISQRKIRSFIKQTSNQVKPNHFYKGDQSIAIVIPCYGHAPYLREMFESIKQQTRQADEVIFVVDAPPDNSFEILQSLIYEFQAQTKSRLILVKNDNNIGQAASLNKGIEIAESELIMILNDDDYLLHDCIEGSLKILEKNPQAALLGGHSLHFGGNSLSNTPKLIQDICPIEDIEIDLRLPSQVSQYRGYNDINMTHSGSSFYKSAWEAIGGYYPDKSKRLVHFSDRDFQLRMNALFPVALSNIAPLSCWRNDSSVDQGVNS
jgi:GT2 family glycosyltransferase